MTLRKLPRVAWMALVGIVLCAAPALANGPGFGWGGLNVVPFSSIGRQFRLSNVPNPPYFSLHPPVYYSYPVPRTYGYSPFPYPGHVRTPEVEVVRPQRVINPHVSPETKPTAGGTGAGRVAVQRIQNPFVLEGFGASEPQLAAGRK